MLLAIFPRTLWPIPVEPALGELILTVSRPTGTQSFNRPTSLTTDRNVTAQAMNRTIMLLVGPAPTTTFAVHR
jgi:hypothetical protein